MKNAVTIFILSITCLSVFKSATPFIGYKMNYEFILKERCEFRGTSQHDDCDGFCYLRKQIKDQHGDDHKGTHSNRAASSNQFSSIYGILEINQKFHSPFIGDKNFQALSYRNDYLVYLDVISPPPKA